MIPMCKHCRKTKVSRPRGLCWGCYYTPGVKEKYPSMSRYSHRGVEDFMGAGKLPQPTSARPGTAEKMEVLELRAQRGQALWHPQDAPAISSDTSPLDEILRRRALMAS